MKSISLELPAETAREILPIMEKKETELRLAFETYAKQVRMVRAAILAAHDRPKAPDAALALPGLVTDPIKSSSGKRVKKGESKHAIESYLSLVGESGTTFSDVMSHAKTTYSTTRRVLEMLNVSGKAKKRGKFWFANF